MLKFNEFFSLKRTRSFWLYTIPGTYCLWFGKWNRKEQFRFLRHPDSKVVFYQLLSSEMACWEAYSNVECRVLLLLLLGGILLLSSIIIYSIYVKVFNQTLAHCKHTKKYKLLCVFVLFSLVNVKFSACYMYGYYSFYFICKLTIPSYSYSQVSQFCFKMKTLDFDYWV